MEALLPGAQHRESGQQRIREVGGEEGQDDIDDNDTAAQHTDVDISVADPDRPAYRARRAYDGYCELSRTGSSTASLALSHPLSGKWG